MFQWYAEASVCYAYLVDIEPIANPDWTLEKECMHAFERSKWWTRGWCLQELIAPQHVEFLASDWSDLGTKFSLRQLISDITGIRLQILIGANLAVCCAAEKMSWASTRETTRPEDVAYCLLGLFGVNMPLLYGEGSTKAFIRLQKEILAQEPDYSLLAWSGPHTQWRVSVDPTPVLASRPQQFNREMELTIVDLQPNRVVSTCMRKPPSSVVRWEDLIFNPGLVPHTSRPKWLKDALEAKDIPLHRFQKYYVVKDPMNVTNRGLHARLHTYQILIDNAPHIAQLSRLLAWTYIIHSDGLLCVSLGPRLTFTFADAVHTRDEAASPILVPFKYLETMFRLDWVYLRLPSPNEHQHQDLRSYRMLRREVLLIDLTAPRPSLFIVAKHPDPILYFDTPGIRTQVSANSEDMRLIGCFLVVFEPVAKIIPSPPLFIVIIGEHSKTNQILLKTVPWDDGPRSTTKNGDPDELAAELSKKRWEVEISALVEDFSNQASFNPNNGEGVVKLRVPARPRSDTLIISMSYIRSTKVEVFEPILSRMPSNNLVEVVPPALVELE